MIGDFSGFKQQYTLGCSGKVNDINPCFNFGILLGYGG